MTLRFDSTAARAILNDVLESMRLSHAPPPTRAIGFITLLSSDGVTIKANEKVKYCSGKIRHMIRNKCLYGDGPYFIDVESDILVKVLRWCIHYSYRSPPEDTEYFPDDMWDRRFLCVDASLLRLYFIAARRMDVVSLVRAICRKYAEMMQDKTEEEILDIILVDKFYEEAHPLFDLLWDNQSNNFISEKAKDFFTTYMVSSIDCDFSRGVCLIEERESEEECEGEFDQADLTRKYSEEGYQT